VTLSRVAIELYTLDGEILVRGYFSLKLICYSELELVANITAAVSIPVKEGRGRKTSARVIHPLVRPKAAIWKDIAYLNLG